MSTKHAHTNEPQGRSAVRSLLRLWPYVRPVRARLFTAAFVAIIASCTGLVIPLVLKWLVDGPVTDRDTAGVWLGALFLLLLGIAEAVLFWVRRWLVARPLARVEADMRAALYGHLQRLPVAFHDRWPSGQLLSRGTTDLMLLRMFLAFPLTFLLVNGVTILVGVIIMLIQDWTLGLVILGPVIPVIVTCVVFEKRYAGVARLAQDQVGDLTTVVEESVLGVRIIKGFGRHRSQARAFRDLSRKLRGTELRKARLLAAIWGVIIVLPEIAIGSALVVGVVQVADGVLSAGTLVAFLSTALALRWPVDSIGFLLAMSQEAATATDRYFEVMDAEEESGTGVRPVSPRGAVEGVGLVTPGESAEGVGLVRPGEAGEGGRVVAPRESVEGVRLVAAGDAAGGALREAAGGALEGAAGVEPSGGAECALGGAAEIDPEEAAGVAASNAAEVAPKGTAGINPSDAPKYAPEKATETAASKAAQVTPKRTAGINPSDAPKYAPEKATETAASKAAQVTPKRTAGIDPSDAVKLAPEGAAGVEPSGTAEYAPEGADGVLPGLVFHDVTFRYPDAPPDAPPVLSGIDLRIRPGESMALVGATGSGKTTLTALVPRLHEITDGRITLDGVDITAMPREELRAAVAVAFEEPTLFSASVGENVLMGAGGDAGDAELNRALAVAQADFAHALPQGTDTQVGEQGLSLSGGQRQRLALARAVVGRPRFLVLDDPLSALDVHTEAAVEAALRQVLADTTALIVAHRPSTVLLADRVALLSGGRITAVGTHQELLRGNAEYAHLMSGVDADPPAGDSPATDFGKDGER